jgi:hypothetical protein
VSVPATGGVYEFQYFSSSGGPVSGSLTFTDKDSGAMLWYTLEIEVASPLAESIIEVKAEVRRAVAVDISLDNPSNEECVFSVRIEGTLHCV